MNRRQFLGPSLSTTIASAALPWDRFFEWCKSWLPKPRDMRAFLDAKAREIDALYERLGEQFSQTLWGTGTITAVDRTAGTITVDYA